MKPKSEQKPIDFSVVTQNYNYKQSSSDPETMAIGISREYVEKMRKGDDFCDSIDFDGLRSRLSEKLTENENDTSMADSDYLP